MNEIKICSYCGKEITAEGRKKFCSAECQSVFYREKRQINDKKEQRRAYREVNREKIREKAKAYREANKEKIKEIEKAYRKANIEKVKAREKAYRAANKEIIKERMKAYRKANKEKNIKNEGKL